MTKLRLGTRGSPLALVQARMVADAIQRAHGLTVDIQVVKTTGDRVQDRPLAEIGGKALWTKELDRALLDGAIDVAVHSMKDVETIRPDTIRIGAMMPRADVRDRLIGADGIEALPQGARIGTSSPRRAAQMRHRRPDLGIVTFRGNVDTRLRKLAEGEADATLLAAAGLDRLGRSDIGVAIDLLPAPAQGAVGIEARADDAATLDLLRRISDPRTFDCVSAERAFLAGLGADCHSPVAALAVIGDGGMVLRAEILSEDGAERVAGEAVIASIGDAAALADRLLGQAPPSLAALFAGR
jgi:hydroxymethylbilane synthase